MSTIWEPETFQVLVELFWRAPSHKSCGNAASTHTATSAPQVAPSDESQDLFVGSDTFIWFKANGGKLTDNSNEDFTGHPTAKRIKHSNPDPLSQALKRDFIGMIKLHKKIPDIRNEVRVSH
jgi:hypothetical protein